MTSRSDQIHSMIADIDNLLSHKGKRLWGVVSSQDEPREILQRIRDFLAREADMQSSTQGALSPLVAKFVSETQQDSGESHNQQSSNNQLLELIEPLKAELKTLLAERANLIGEIKELEKKRLHDYSLAQQLASQEKVISEFMQVLTNRLQDGSITAVSVGSGGNIAGDIGDGFALPSSESRVDSSRLERLTDLTSDLDRRLVALDGTVNVVFEALQRNIHTYHDSLSEALARMHHKGVQGEQLLERFINNFAQLSQQQEYPKLQPQTTDEVVVETIYSQNIQSTEVYNQDLTDSKIIESPEAYKTRENEKLEVTLDETIDENIEFSKGKEDGNDDNITSDLFRIFSQIDEESDTEKLGEELQQDNDLEVELQQEENVLIEEEIIEDSDAFDTPERMEAVLNELKKSAAPALELVANNSDESSDEDEVDELYASLFDSDNLASSSYQSSPQQIRPTAINVEISPKSDFSSQWSEIQIEKEVIEGEVVFEATPPQPPVENQESRDRNESSLGKPGLNSNGTDLTHGGESVNPNPAKTYKRKTKVASGDTINSLRQLVFEEEEPLSTLTPSSENSKSQLTVDIEPQIPIPIQKQVEQKIPTSELQQPKQLEEINEQKIPTSELQQPKQLEDVNQQKEQKTTTSELQQPKQLEDVIKQKIPTSELQQPKQLEEIKEQKIPTSELQQPNQLEDVNEPLQETPQLKEITPTITSPAQPNKNSDGTVQLNPLPQTEKTISTPDQENSSQENSIAINTPEIPNKNLGNTVWYLGLDLGTTGISAALLNRSTTEIHPIYWTNDNQPQVDSQTINFRLPAEVYLPKTSLSQDSGENSAEQNIYSAYLKPYLQISLPYKNISETASTQVRQRWEPILQLNEFSTVPLVWIVRSLSKLLLTLKSDSNSTTLGLTATAIGIDKEEFNSIINNIAGIICTCPSNWSEQYRFNIRESLLIAELVEHPQQVFFVEEAIASLMVELEGANGEIVKLVPSENSPAINTSDSNLLGNTLVINIGASATEMALVDIPENLQDLTHNEFMLHGFSCGGKAMEQDIITQLLLPPKWRQSRKSKSSDSSNEDKSLHWKPNIPGLEQIRFSSLGLEHLELPRPGEPDISQRITLQKRLESSPLGKALLDAAIALKLILQHQESFIIELADQRWELQKRDLEGQVFVPFVRRINRELNKLLVARGIPTEAIDQIILSGGVSSINAISRWLHQKLPSAKIIQEKYLGNNGTPACSRVATGLCVLPLHPLVLEIPRQQYTDYFLFTELLRLVPEKAITFGEVIQLFEGRGINTRSCQQRLLAFLEGEIPPGLAPKNQDMQWLNQSSVENSYYKAITASPLFDKQGSLSYRPNLRQLQYLRNYLNAIKASAHQSLEEPYIVNFAVVVNE